MPRESGQDWFEMLLSYLSPADSRQLGLVGAQVWDVDDPLVLGKLLTWGYTSGWLVGVDTCLTLSAEGERVRCCVVRYDDGGGGVRVTPVQARMSSPGRALTLAVGERARWQERARKRAGRER